MFYAHCKVVLGIAGHAPDISGLSRTSVCQKSGSENRKPIRDWYSLSRQITVFL